MVTSARPADPAVDDLNRAIVRLLQENARMPYRTMADRLGVSEGAVGASVTWLVLRIHK